MLLSPALCNAYGDYSEDLKFSVHVQTYRIPLAEGQTYLQVINNEDKSKTEEEVLVECSSILYPLDSKFYISRNKGVNTLELITYSIRCLSEEERDVVKELYPSVIFVQNFSSVQLP